MSFKAASIRALVGLAFVIAFASNCAAEGVCARVVLQLDQDAWLTRRAYSATITIADSDSVQSIEGVAVRIEITDGSGARVDSRFEVQAPSLQGLSSVDGTGTIAPNSSGQARWLIVPGDGAALSASTQYYVGGTMSYKFDGKEVVIPLVPVGVTVYPEAALRIDYFHQRDVLSDDPATPAIEPAQPYVLAIMVNNAGQGVARNLAITSAQPKIVDNEKGLLIDFRIISSELLSFGSTGPKTEAGPSALTLAFGDLQPGEIKIGEWKLSSSLQGLFVDYNASFQHLDGSGDAAFSLIKNVAIHEMIRQVEDAAARPAFLVNDVADPRDLPDTVYLVDGTAKPVTVRETAAIEKTVVGEGLSVNVTVSPTAGWSYLRIPDPAAGKFPLVKATRSDGRSLTVGSSAWTTDRTFVGLGKPPVRENILHLADVDSTGSYTLVFGAAPASDTTAPESAVAPLPPESYDQIPLTWAGTDAFGVVNYDIFVSDNGGAFTLWKGATTSTGAIFAGSVGHNYAFYSRARDAAGNYEAAPAAPDAATKIVQPNLPPVLDSVANQTLARGQSLDLQLHGSDPNPGTVLTFRLGLGNPSGVVLAAGTGHLTWPTSPDYAGKSYHFSVEVWDNGYPRLSATRTFDVSIANANSAPLLSSAGPQTAKVGQLFELQFSATDADLPAQTLSFSIVGTILPGLSIDSATGLLRWTPTASFAASTVNVRVRVTDSGIPALFSETNLIIAVTGSGSDLTYDQWKKDRFTEQQLADPFVSGDAADPDGDGVANMLEFVLGTDPLHFSAFGGKSGPLVKDDDKTYFTFTYTRVRGRTGVDQAIEVSADAVNWTPVSDVRVVDNGDGTENVTGVDPVDQGSASGRLMRLKVKKSP